jgi:hypothetical protein
MKYEIECKFISEKLVVNFEIKLKRKRERERESERSIESDECCNLYVCMHIVINFGCKKLKQTIAKRRRFTFRFPLTFFQNNLNPIDYSGS